MLEKALIFSGVGGKITYLTTVTLLEMKYVSKNSYLGILTLKNVSITLKDKTDNSDLKIREDYWRKTLKTFFLFRLDIEDSVICVMLHMGYLHAQVCH